MRMNEVLEYLQRAWILGIIPNFWLTANYMGIQDAKLQNNGKVIWVEEGEWAIFPPLPVGSNDFKKENCPPLRVWSDFENFGPGEEEEFLDWEYSYNSDAFKDMSGGKWKVFRKNSRKWPRDNEGWNYSFNPPKDCEIEALLVRWLEVRDEIEDSESMLWFLLRGPLRGFLYRGDELVGVNAWDSNEPYLMYRYCMTDPNEPFLDEFARLLFYQSVPGRTVIDGGALGNPGLERFKDKLNPVKKRAVYSRKI